MAYWAVPVVVSILTFFIMSNIGELSGGKLYYRTFYTFMGIIVLFYAPKLVFVTFELGNDIANGFLFLLKKANIATNNASFPYLRYIGAAFAFLLFFFSFYGILHGRYHYKVNEVELEYSKLPKQFDGFKVVHITDWHIGSYYGKPERIEEAVEQINALNPDLILFTGDLVNNIATEVDEFIPSLKKLKAKYGKYSVLGNHDYGEYVNWKNKSESENNLNRLKEIEQEVGFVLLNNESRTVEIEGEKINLVGVENWGLPPFPQHGDLNKALLGLNGSDFKILMSHDPSHWDEEVNDKTDIDLTLSGHTHGMQFGINLPKFKWSPVKLKYPKWAGLYEENGQKLFVSVGIGYIGFPGRVGMRPEIALFTLRSK